MTIAGCIIAAVLCVVVFIFIEINGCGSVIEDIISLVVVVIFLVSIGFILGFAHDESTKTASESSAAVEESATDTDSTDTDSTTTDSTGEASYPMQVICELDNDEYFVKDIIVTSATHGELSKYHLDDGSTIATTAGKLIWYDENDNILLDSSVYTIIPAE